MDAIDPKATALVIQDLQNDVIIEGGAFADSGAPAHATSQNVVENVGPRRGLPRGRRAGDPRLVHRRAGRAGPEAERAALRRRQGRERARARTLGRRAGRRARAAGRRPRRREDADERLLQHEARHPAARVGVETLDHHGAWTNMSIEHTARTRRTPATAPSSPRTARRP